MYGLVGTLSICKPFSDGTSGKLNSPIYSQTTLCSSKKINPIHKHRLLARILETYPGADGRVHVVKILLSGDETGTSLMHILVSKTLSKMSTLPDRPNSGSTRSLP